MHRRVQRLRLTVAAVAAVAALAAAGCSSASKVGKHGPVPARGGVATVASIAALGANWIFPFMSVQYFDTANLQDFQYLMYRPLYYFGGENTSVTANYALSLAAKPVYRDGGRTVVINLKGWKWSDGETVDARDVMFWLHMMEAEGANWAGSLPGGIPRNIASMASTGPDQVTLNLTRAFSSSWYTDNELSQITPMPMAWDISGPGGAPGSGGCTSDTAADATSHDPNGYAKCVAVYNYLTSQARDAGSYAAPASIWATVDGPWRLSAYSASGSYTLVPNPKYSGRPKPYLTAVRFVSYSSQGSVFSALTRGAVDIGTVPPQDLPAKPAGKALPRKAPLQAAYMLQAAYPFEVNYYLIDFTNPANGPLFRQLYFRQALQFAVNQNAMIETAFRGYGYATTGPVPAEPASPWLPGVQRRDGPYPYSIARARALLAGHGWTEVHGIDTCTRPGTAATECGAGISKGQQLTFDFYEPAYVGLTAPEARIYSADAAQAGIDLKVSVYYTGLLGPPWESPCTLPSGCSWQLAMNFGGWLYAPDYEPTGEDMFASGASYNLGSYSDPEMDDLIGNAETSSSPAAFRAFATYAARQLPVIWLPDSYSVVAVRSSLHGVVQNPLGAFMPEYWYYARKKSS